MVEKGRDDWRPKRLVRTVVSSMKSARDFGRQMAKEAKQRRFFEATAKVFLGDGLPWNWTIWTEHFRDFTPVLDFIHPLSYLFLAAKTVHPSSDDDGWSQYLAWMRGCWQGEVGQVLDELRVWQDKLGEPSPDAPDSDPRKIIAGTVLLGKQSSADELPRVPQGGPSGHHGVDGVLGQGSELSREGDGDVLEPSRGRGGDSSGPCRRAERRRSAEQVSSQPPRLPVHPPSQTTQTTRQNLQKLVCTPARKQPRLHPKAAGFRIQR